MSGWCAKCHHEHDGHCGALLHDNYSGALLGTCACPGRHVVVCAGGAKAEARERAISALCDEVEDVMRALDMSGEMRDRLARRIAALRKLGAG